MNTQVLLHMMLCRLVVTDVSERQAQENKHLVLFKCHYNVWYIYIYIYIYIYMCVCVCVCVCVYVFYFMSSVLNILISVQPESQRISSKFS